MNAPIKQTVNTDPTYLFFLCDQGKHADCDRLTQLQRIVYVCRCRCHQEKP